MGKTKKFYCDACGKHINAGEYLSGNGKCEDCKLFYASFMKKDSGCGCSSSESE